MRFTVKLQVEIAASCSGPNSDQTPYIEQQDPLVPTLGEATGLFKLLKNVTHLTMSGSTRLATLLLTRDVSIISLPKLEVLELASAFSDIADPFYPLNYSNIPNYDNLEELSLAVWRNARTIQANPIETFNSSLLSGSRIISVILNGPLSSSESCAKALLSSFDSLALLTLTDNSPTSKMYDLLDALKSPEELEYLSLRRFYIHGAPPDSSFPKMLGKLTSLDCLILAGTSAPLSPEFYSSLKSAPLQQISFEFDADVDLTELTKLISGPSKHKTLEEIGFNNAEASGSSRSWVMLSGWTQNFNPRTLRSFLDVASTEGIRIDGRALEALKMEEGCTGETGSSGKSEGDEEYEEGDEDE